jgi:hypothetical protein
MLLKQNKKSKTIIKKYENSYLNVKYLLNKKASPFKNGHLSIVTNQMSITYFYKFSKLYITLLSFYN